MRSRFQRRMIRKSRRQQRNQRQFGDDEREPLLPKSDTKQSLGSNGSLCASMAEPDCNAASLACEWTTRSDTGTSSCRRRARGTKANMSSFDEIEARNAQRLSEFKDMYNENTKKSLGSNGSLCASMAEPDCNAASLACEWTTRSDTGTSSCRRRARGTKANMSSFDEIESRNAQRLSEFKDRYAEDAELRSMFSDSQPSLSQPSLSEPLPTFSQSLPTFRGRMPSLSANFKKSKRGKRY